MSLLHFYCSGALPGGLRLPRYRCACVCIMKPHGESLAAAGTMVSRRKSIMDCLFEILIL